MESHAEVFGTLSGFSNAQKSRGCRSTIWYCLGVIGLTLTFFRMNSIIQEYFETPVLTQVSLEKTFGDKLFPSVTMCSLNKVNCANVAMFMSHIPTNPEAWKSDESKVCSVGKLAGCYLTCQGDLEVSALPFEDAYNSLSWRSKLLVGESLESFVAQWKFRDMTPTSTSTPAEWTHSYLPFAGTCATFNWKGTFKDHGNGPGNGLEVVLRLNYDSELQAGISEGRHGIQLMIQQNSQPASLTMNTMDLQPGAGHALSLRRSSWSQSQSKGQCITQWADTKVRFVRENEQVRSVFATIGYNQDYCEAYCNLESIFEQCGCVYAALEYHPKLRDHTFLTSDGRKSKSCIKSNATQEKCCIEAKVLNPVDQCGCHYNCNQEDFSVLASQTTWPADSNWKSVAEEFNISPPTFHETELKNLTGISPKDLIDYVWQEKIKGSLMKVNIYFRTQEQLDFKEESKYKDIWDFLANLGGSMSVFMGISFVAIIEVLEGIILFYWSFFSCKMCKKNQAKPQKIETPAFK